MNRLNKVLKFEIKQLYKILDKQIFQLKIIHL